MSAIFSVNFGTISPQMLPNRPVEQTAKDSGEKYNQQKEIVDTANLSNVSKNLSDRDASGFYLPIDLSEGCVDSVRSFILNHKTDAIDQQANQSQASSLALIS